MRRPQRHGAKTRLAVILLVILTLPVGATLAQESTAPLFDWPWLSGTHSWTSGPHGWDARCRQLYTGDRALCIGTEIPGIEIRSGLDFGGDGWEVHPMAPGSLVYSGRLPSTLGYGVVVDHGELQTVYAHMAETGLREELGDVTREDVLGESACTGPCGTGPHLHVDLRRDAGRNEDGTLSYGRPVPWDGQVIAGWTIAAAALNYDGTATRGDVELTAEADHSTTFTILATSMVMPSTVEWSDTGIDLEDGEFVRISASGTFDNGSDVFTAAMTPDGCIEPQGFPCWSLIGRFDGGPPFAVGSHYDAVVDGGHLQLGIADDSVEDNAGAWEARVRVRGQASQTIAVGSRRRWTDAIEVPAGARLRVDATGSVSVYPDEIRMGPDGCVGVAHRTPYGIFIGRRLPCWSLIGRVGRAGKPFAVGSSWLGALPAGRLYLGANDDYHEDNTGSWRVTVRQAGR